MHNNNVYASYNGSQRGFSVRNFKLEQESCVTTGIDFSSIAAGANNDVYLTSANHIYHYNVDGTLIKDFAFPSADIIYTSVVVKGDKVYAAYEGSQIGITVRSLELSQLSCFTTEKQANGIAAGQDNDIYIASANHIFNYKVDGTLIKVMTFPVDSINYTDVTALGDKLLASYSGPQDGFTVRDLALNQLSFTNTNFVPHSIAAGSGNDLYLTCNNHIYNFSTQGIQLNDVSFPDSSINYTSVGVIFTTMN